jgi:hypothetical protein
VLRKGFADGEVGVLLMNLGEHIDETELFGLGSQFGDVDYWELCTDYGFGYVAYRGAIQDRFNAQAAAVLALNGTKVRGNGECLLVAGWHSRPDETMELALAHAAVRAAESTGPRPNEATADAVVRTLHGLAEHLAS